MRLWLHLFEKLVQRNPAVDVLVKPGDNQVNIVRFQVVEVVVSLHDPCDVVVSDVLLHLGQNSCFLVPPFVLSFRK